MLNACTSAYSFTFNATLVSRISTKVLLLSSAFLMCSLIIINLRCVSARILRGIFLYRYIMSCLSLADIILNLYCFTIFMGILVRCISRTSVVQCVSPISCPWDVKR